MMRRRRPVLGTVARTAVVAGTAQAVAGRVNHNQQQKWAAQAAEQAPPPAAPAPPPAAPAPSAGTAMDEKLAQLQQLGELRDQGILTEAEFEAQKAAVLAS
jgi:hypothetical protein